MGIASLGNSRNSMTEDLELSGGGNSFWTRTPHEGSEFTDFLCVAEAARQANSNVWGLVAEAMH
jgi:hypothetical protein